MQKCRKCKKVLEKDGKTRVKVRARTCRWCRSDGIVKRRKKSAVAFLSYKMYNSMRHIPKIDKKLWSTEVVQRIWTRCNKKSVIGGESDHIRLCIHPLRKGVYTEDNMVVLSTSEAMSLAKIKDESRRLARFSANKVK